MYLHYTNITRTLKKTVGSGTSGCLLTKYRYDNKMYADEMGGTCGTCGSKQIENSWETPKGSDSFGDLNVDWGIILNWVLKKYVGKGWSGFIWLKDQWRVLVNMAMNFLVL